MLGTSQPPRCARSTPVKHPQPLVRPQHPQPPGPAANHNSAWPDLLDQTELGRLYKLARPSISKDTTTRYRRDNFSGSNLSFNCSQRSHRDYFSGSPCRALNRNWHLTDALREASPVAVRERSDPTQTPPRAALPDVSIDMGVELPEAALQQSWRYPAAIQSSLSLAGARKHPVNGSGLQHEAIRDRGPALLLLHYVLESVHPQPVDGVSNGSLTYKQRTLARSLSLTE